MINVTAWVHLGKIWVNLISVWLLISCYRILLISKIDINFCLSLMFFRPLAALKNSSKKKETVIEKDIVEVYKGCNKGYKRRQKNIRLG